MKTGRRSKDSPISDQFNEDKIGNLNKTGLSAILAGGKKAAKLAKKKVETTEEKKFRQEVEKAEKFEKENLVDKDNQKSAQQMLSDLRFAYRNAIGPGGQKGKTRLVELMKSDNEFKFMVKELTRVETAILSAQIRKEGPDVQAGNQMTFVILKGLDDEKSVTGELTPEAKQIAILLNPDGSEMETTH